jgi:hypothetical protein
LTLGRIRIDLKERDSPTEILISPIDTLTVIHKSHRVLVTDKKNNH